MQLGSVHLARDEILDEFEQRDAGVLGSLVYAPRRPTELAGCLVEEFFFVEQNIQ
jgi:hypothetical protein